MGSAFNPGKTLFLGASRGIGAAILKSYQSKWPQNKWVHISRTSGSISSNHINVDFADTSRHENALSQIIELTPSTVIYSAGGGAYGLFGEKNWRDHEWALQVNLIFPAKILHRLLKSQDSNIKRFVCLGSSVAESQADPKAASYSMAKHGLLGLHRSIVQEDPRFDFRLYSPGYTDTSLLPPNAAVRRDPIWSTQDVSKDFWQWLESGPRHDHRSLAIRPDTL